MKRIIAITAVVVSVLLALVFAGGCKGQRIAERIAEEAIEKAIEQDSGENVEIDLDEGEVTIQSDEGEVSISSDDETVEIKSDEGEATFGTGAELPEGFPDSVPVYENMTITSSWKSSEGDKNNYSITAISEDSVDDVFGWYKTKLEGWDIEGEFALDTDEGKTASLGANSGGIEMTLMTSDSDEGTIVVQTVSK